MQIGLVFALMGTTSVLVQATCAGWLARRLGEYRMLLLAMLVQAGGLLCIGLADTLPLVLLGTVGISIGYAVLNPAVTSLASFAADEDLQGAAQGVVQGASALGRVVGPASAGPAYDAFGPTAPYLAGGCQLLIIVAFAALWRPPAENLPRAASA